MQSESINELAAALSSLQGALEGAKKDSTNPYFKSKYADLEAVWEAARPLLQPNGLSVTQTMGYLATGEVPVTTLITTLLHSSGQWIGGEMPLYLKVQDAQGQGSAITYARRYCLAAILGIHQTDDDAESAITRSNNAKGAMEAKTWTKAQASPRVQEKEPVQAQQGQTVIRNQEVQREAVRKQGTSTLSSHISTTAGVEASSVQRAAHVLDGQEIPGDVSGETQEIEKGDSAAKISAIKQGLLGVLTYCQGKGHTEEELDAYIRERFGVDEKTALQLSSTQLALILNHFVGAK